MNSVVSFSTSVNITTGVEGEADAEQDAADPTGALDNFTSHDSTIINDSGTDGSAVGTGSSSEGEKVEDGDETLEEESHVNILIEDDLVEVHINKTQ